MRKAIILLSAFLFIVLIPTAFSLPDTTYAPNGTMSKKASDYLDKFLCGGCFDDGTICNPLTNASAWTLGTVGAGSYQSSACEINLTGAGSNGGANLISAPNIVQQGWACDWQEIYYDTSPAGHNYLIGADADTILDDDNSPMIGWIGGVNSNKHLLYYAPDQWSATSNFNRPGNTWYNMTMNFSSATAHEAFFNNSNNLRVKQTSGTFTYPFYFTAYNYNSASGVKVGIKRIFCYNATTGAPQQVETTPDTAPPEIIHYNLSTPSGDCTVWNVSKSTPCSTGDTTPTVMIKTNEPAYCAIGLLDKNFSYYDALGINRSCENGGTQSLICTLRSEDELTYEDYAVYIGCKDTNDYENSTSTSGALSLQITGLESGSDAAIGVGVQNALLSGYTNYTSQQIYARKLNNVQDSGTFDWVAKKGSKVWTFNCITKGEEHVGMFNMSPALYVLEMSNITNSTIIQTVEAMINATK